MRNTDVLPHMEDIKRAKYWLWLPNRFGDDIRDNIFRLIFTPMESELCFLLYDAQRSSNYSLKISICLKFPFDYQKFGLKIGLKYFIKKSFLSYVYRTQIKHVRNRRSDCKHASGLSSIKNKGGRQ